MGGLRVALFLYGGIADSQIYTKSVTYVTYSRGFVV